MAVHDSGPGGVAPRSPAALVCHKQRARAIASLTMENAHLLELARTGDGQAFADLVQPHLRRLRASIALRAPARHLVDEVAHDAVVHAYRTLETFDGADLGAWLSRIAWHLLRAETQRFARQQVQLSRYAVEMLRETASPANFSDEISRLQRCLEALPGHLRSLVEQRYHEGLSSESMAERLGRTAEWIRTNLYRLRSRLRSCMEDGHD